MIFKIYDSPEKITEEKLEKFEQKWKIKFPLEYRKFLLKYNGGRPEPVP